MVASSCSSAKVLLPMDTEAPLPLLPDPLGQAPPVLVALPPEVPELPPPQPARTAPHTVSMIARDFLFTDVSFSWLVLPTAHLRGVTARSTSPSAQSAVSAKVATMTAPTKTILSL